MTRRPSRKGSNDHTRAPEVLNGLGGHKKIELDPLIDAWEPQPGESPRNYGLFQMYRDFGRLRTVSQIASMSPVLKFTTIANIARKNRWTERAALWDAEQDRITSIRLLDAREELARKHAKAADALLSKAMDALLSLDPARISPNALVLMFATAAQIGRAALGQETMNKGAQQAAQTTVTVAASTATDSAGKPEMRVEVGVQHDKIMATLDAMVARMSPEQIAAGYEELAASADEAVRELNAALPAPPPQ